MTLKIEKQTDQRVHIVIISMSTAYARRKAISDQMSACLLEWSFFDGHDTPDPELNLHTQAWPALNGRILSSNEINCYSSHFSILRTHAKKQDASILIVIEDDAIINVDYLNQYSTIYKSVTEHGYIRMNAQLAASSNEIAIYGRHRLVRFKKSVHGTLGYMIDTQTAQIFYDHLRNLRRAVDMEMDRFWAHGVQIKCLYQFIAIERSAITQIERIENSVKGKEFVMWKMINQVEKIRRFFANIKYDFMNFVSQIQSFIFQKRLSRV